MYISVRLCPVPEPRMPSETDTRSSSQTDTRHESCCRLVGNHPRVPGRRRAAGLTKNPRRVRCLHTYVDQYAGRGGDLWGRRIHMPSVGRGNEGIRGVFLLFPLSEEYFHWPPCRPHGTREEQFDSFHRRSCFMAVRLLSPRRSESSVPARLSSNTYGSTYLTQGSGMSMRPGQVP